MSPPHQRGDDTRPTRTRTHSALKVCYLRALHPGLVRGVFALIAPHGSRLGWRCFAKPLVKARQVSDIGAERLHEDHSALAGLPGFNLAGGDLLVEVRAAQPDHAAGLRDRNSDWLDAGQFVLHGDGRARVLG